MAITNGPQRAIPELSVDTQVLERLLQSAAIGAVVTYQQLSEAIGRNVQTRARHLLDTAQRRLLRDHQMVFAAVVNVGIKRLDDAGIVGTGTAAVRRIHNLSRRGVRRLAAVKDYDGLPNAQKLTHNITIGQLGMLAHATKQATVRKLEAHVTDTLPVAKFLDAMRETL